MRAKISVALAAILVALTIAAGCSKSESNDAQIIGQVTTKVQADGSVQTKAIAIQSNHGVVTLSGQVASDAERNEIAADAAQVEGVKTVVNNLTVANAAAAPAPVVQPPSEEPKPERAKSSARHRDEHKSYGNTPAVAPVATPAPMPAPTPVAQAPVTPPPPPKPVTITVPAGTEIAIRLVDPLDSEKNQVGDRFRATIAHSIRVGDEVVIPTGADVEGRVVDVKNAAHFTGQSVLAVELTDLSMGGHNYELHTAEIRRQGAARGTNTVEKVGGGAAVGAIIGAIAGGGKGAAIGSVIGAGAGTGAQAATRGQQIRLPVESALNFQLASPVAVTPSAKPTHQDNGPVLTDRSNGNGGNGGDAGTYNDNSNYSDNGNNNDSDQPVLQRRPNDNNNNQPN
ncbi:MAG TPA: BON domain-containing protein [Terriglobales bacterium]|nr:BON domain-containing protein [Terriglobales bacterium]